MKSCAYLQSAAAITTSGMFSMLNGATEWEPDQKSPFDIRRSQVIDTPMPEFGKLQSAEKLAFCAAAKVFSDVPHLDRSSYGITLGTSFGSFFTDIRYMKSVISGFPSPALFSATLPSSPVAEIAIRFHLTGPNRVITGSDFPCVSAIDSAFSLIKNRKTSGAIAVAVNANEPAVQYKAFEAFINADPAYSFAFLFTADPQPKCRNIRMTIEGETDTADMHMTSKESYFLEILKSCHNLNSGSVTFKTAGLTINMGKTGQR
jgi:3-oxoacyl-(acyl-carrier-protein) synthase